jgi:alanine dehydrogenase
MLFIHNDVVAKLLTMRECIDAQEQAFRQVPSGGAIQRPRLDMYVPCERDDGYYRWSTVEGTSDGILAMRMKSDVGRSVRTGSGAKANTACSRAPMQASFCS